MHPFARRLLVLAAVFPLIAPVGTADAQNADEPTISLLPTYFDLDFPGGTLEQFAAAVRRANEDATLVISEEALGFRLPAVTLRQVDVSAAARLIERVAQAPDNSASRLDVNWVEVPASANVAVSINAWTNPEVSDTETRTWSVREHLDRGLAADDLLSAVQAMLEVEPGAADVRFHEPTALLIIRGTEAQLNLVNDGLGQMRAEVRGRANDEESIRNEIAILEDQLAESEAQMRVAGKAVEVAQLRVKEALEAFEKGLLSQVDLGEAELEVVQAEANLQMIMRRIDRLSSEIERLRSRLDD